MNSITSEYLKNCPSKMYSFRCTIIGAGVVGLAVAHALSYSFNKENDLLVIEKEETFGKGTSSRNSGVIHSGLYYPTGSLKHKLCISGRRKLYNYCDKKNIYYNKCGKLIVAINNDEISELYKLYDRALINEVENIDLINKKMLDKLETEISGQEALLLKETGIINSHSLMKACEYDIKENNAIILYQTRVTAIKQEKNYYKIKLNDGTVFNSEYVINSAGLDAIKIAGLLEINKPDFYPCKGSYFGYSKKINVSHLIYPVPEKNLTGLGVHATIDLDGRLRFGPDVEYVNSTEDFSVDKAKLDSFYKSAKKIFPSISKEHLFPEMAGIRPKLQGPNDCTVKDFYIKEEKDQGFPKFINLLGIESPGLTSSMAIGDYVLNLIRQ